MDFRNPRRLKGILADDSENWSIAVERGLLTKYLDSRNAGLLTKYFGSMGPRISIAQDVNRKRIWRRLSKWEALRIKNENDIYRRLEMKLSWKEVQIFGLGLLIPVFAFITQKLNPDRAALLQSAGCELEGCARCHKLLSVNAGMSFILHLQDAHKIEADDSYEIISDVYRRTGNAYRERSTKRKSGEHQVEVTA